MKRSAVSVVPIPSSFPSVDTASAMPWLASSTASRNVVIRSSMGWSSSRYSSEPMTSLLATSPAAWPPMPSAIASNRGPAYTESSLLLRTSPRSERTA